MEVDARRFNSRGVEEFKMILGNARAGYKSNQAAKFTSDHLEAVSDIVFDDDLTEIITPSFKLNLNKKFTSRLSLGQYLRSSIPDQSPAAEYENVGFWAWVTSLYFEQLLKPNSGGKTFQLWTNPRYIPEATLSKRRYYRHLCYLPYLICKSHPPGTAEFFLSLLPFQHSDIIEQLYTSDQSFTPYPGVIEVAKKLYIDPSDGSYRKNFLGRSTAGSAFRLAKVICNQWQMNYDLHVLSEEQIWDLLPKEFNGWKRLVSSQTQTDT